MCKKTPKERERKGGANEYEQIDSKDVIYLPAPLLIGGKVLCYKYEFYKMDLN
jgi:hypothetical protein